MQTTQEAKAIAQKTERGGRQCKGWQGQMVFCICLAWALFQVYATSLIPYTLTDWSGINVLVNNDQMRFIHLAFALVLAAFAFPLLKNSPTDRIPLYDWALAFLGAMPCLYLIIFKDAIALRAGLPTATDMAMSALGLVVLGIAVYRALGLPLLVVTSFFLSYVFFGSASWLPDVVRWKGASFGKAMWHYWMQTEGVFGVALGVSTTMIFLFVLFGAMLEKAGAGNYFIQISFALLGHFKGGPAKAAVFASAMSGIYSGSSIANTVTTGTFTIPLMKRTGFPSEKAGAVEVASSTNGQLMPPVMGAAAFLIAEFTGVSYQQIVIHAFLPAVISYAALIYIVHLEALKMGLQGVPKNPRTPKFAVSLLRGLGTFISLCILGGVVYYGLGWMKKISADFAFYGIIFIVLLAYLWLVHLAAKAPDLKTDDPGAPLLELPLTSEVARTGLYFVLPLVILIWCIMLERFSPGLSAFWAIVAMGVISATQAPLKAYFRHEDHYYEAFKKGLGNFVQGVVAGSRNMIGIAVATGAAGVIIGSVSLTGAHQMLGEFVEFLSGGQLMVMLLLVAVMSLILGMGLPTTANYIVVSSLMAPVIVALGAKSGLVVPLIAVHLFVFYFGILADDTPPVGLAAFAAAAISQGDPIKTGIQGFTYDIRTAILPFLFLFNTKLLLIDVTWWEAIVVFITALIAMLLFAAATQGYFMVKNRLWESLLLLLVAFTLFRPGFWLDRYDAPFQKIEGAALMAVLEAPNHPQSLTLNLVGPSFANPDLPESSTIVLAPGTVSPLESLKTLGLAVSNQNGQAVVDSPDFSSKYALLDQKFDFFDTAPVRVQSLLLPKERMPREVFYLPAFLLLMGVIFFQHRRKKRANVP